MTDYKRIKKECFWDLNFQEDDIREILEGFDERSRVLLFEKILLNSTKLLLDLKLFKKDELKSMLEKFKVPRFNHEYIFRRKNISEVYFFNKPLEIDELKWPA
jgi:hypothetical protein